MSVACCLQRDTMGDEVTPASGSSRGVAKPGERSDMAKGMCSVEGCGRPHHARGFCGRHCQQARARGDEMRPRAYLAGSTLDRVLAKTDRSGGPDACWPWTGCLSNGYGQLRIVTESTALAHRLAYMTLVGPIPEGLILDHTCHDPEVCHPEVASDCPHRRCMNPAHLRPATYRENLLRGGTITAANLSRTHCPQGHPYDGYNLSMRRDGARSCKACGRASAAKSAARRRAEGSAA